jgi:hypothetical protein
MALGQNVDSKKLIYEPPSFSDSERQLIRAAGSQVNRWRTTIDLAFAKRYRLSGTFRKEALPATARLRYDELRQILDRDLKPLIELRNSLAHGQWVYPLTNDELSVSTQQKLALSSENSLTIKLKGNLIAAFTNVINDLVVSKPTFERDYDKHFRVIESAHLSLQHRSYNDYVRLLQDRYQRGKSKRRAVELI